MAMHDEELREFFRETRDRETPPQFDTCWRQAQLRVGASRDGSRWRWALGPTVFVGVSAAVAAVVALYPPAFPGPGRASDEESARAVAPIAETSAGEEDGGLPSPGALENLEHALALDWLLEESGLATENGYGTVSNGDFQLNTETDFLLTIEIPSWNGTEEREVL
jgi:hypothetical protein